MMYVRPPCNESFPWGVCEVSAICAREIALMWGYSRRSCVATPRRYINITEIVQTNAFIYHKFIYTGLHADDDMKTWMHVKLSCLQNLELFNQTSSIKSMLCTSGCCKVFVRELGIFCINSNMTRHLKCVLILYF